MRIHELEEPTLDDLDGYEVRLNEPGGRHFEGELHQGMADVRDLDGKRPPPGTYELSFRPKGSTGWANDARLPTIEV
jgi:hypothetical protein